MRVAAPDARRRARRLAVAAALGALLAAAPRGLAATAGAGWPWPWCLPAVFDGGERLHGLPGPSVFWLELLLRQHEICHRDVPGEVRIVLTGASSVFGFPYPAEQTFAHRLNQSFAATGVPAHVFNLAFVNPYQVRDAVILSEARRFAPDIILYPITRSEFIHVAPVLFPPVGRFFDANRRAVARLAADPPAGLDAPFRTYASYLTRPRATTSPLDFLRESGSLVRTGARLHARAVAAAAGAELAPLADPKQRKPTYDCDVTHTHLDKNFAGWQDWNILSYLEEMHRRDGTDVVIVFWPIAFDPSKDCYNARDTVAGVAEFATWLRDQTAARQLGFVDLHAALAPQLFLDSLHVSAEGHGRVTELLAQALQPVIAARLQRCRATGTGCGQ